MRLPLALVTLLAGALIAFLIYSTDPTVPENGAANEPSPVSVAANAEATDVAALPEAPPVNDTPGGPIEIGRSVSENDDEDGNSAKTPIDEGSVRIVRESAAREVHESYALLLEDLDLTTQQNEQLLAFLIEARIANSRVFHNGSAVRIGTPVSEEARPDRIAAIIGHTKLQRFLALERNLDSYRETYRIGALLERSGTPLSAAQSDGLFDILVASREQSMTIPRSDADLGSVESIEQTLTRLGERERYVIALTPSVLSPQQVVYLHESYQLCSYARIDDLQRQVEHRANQSNEAAKFGYLNCSP